MTRTKLILSLSSLFCLLLSVPAYSQEPGAHSEGRAREIRLRLFEAEFNLKMQELELAMSERAVEEAVVEWDKVKLYVEGAQGQGDPRELELAKLGQKQVQDTKRAGLANHTGNAQLNGSAVAGQLTET